MIFTGTRNTGTDRNPSPLRSAHALTAAFVFLVALTVYLLTVTPTVSFWDGGEFVTTSAILGVPHPPGAPLLSLVGRVMSMIPFPDLRGGTGEIAYRVNLIGVFSAAFSALLIYLLAVSLIRRIAPLSGDIRKDFPVFVSGAAAALTAAFSGAFWANAVEVETYMPSLLISLLAILLALRWEERKHLPDAVRYLFLASYILGLGTGVHLTALLAAGPVFLIVFTAKPRLFADGAFWSAALCLAAGAVAIHIIAGRGAIPVLLLAAVLVGPAAAFFLAKPSIPRWGRTAAALLVLCAVFAAGRSVYPTIMIRAAKNPAVNEGAPRTAERYRAYLDREQYGQGTTGAMLRGMTTRKAKPGYQFGFMYFRYLLRQLPSWGPSVPVTFANDRSAEQPGQVMTVTERAYVPVFVWALIFMGMGFHVRRDPRRFTALFGWFLLTSAGLVLYLNMENPQVRERDYFFLCSYVAVMVWLGIGMFCALRGVQSLLDRMGSRRVIPVTGMLAFVFATIVPSAAFTDPSGEGVSNAWRYNRSHDRTALDYAASFLDTCAPRAILFTSGDNDTYPLWYAREVLGVRRDVTIVNLNLLDAPWYIRQLRGGDPGVPVSFTDEFIDAALSGNSPEAQSARLWDAVPREVSAGGITWMLPPDMTGTLSDGRQAGMLSVRTMALVDIIRTANGTRPIYFAVTVGPDAMIGLFEHFSLEGMAFRLVPERAPDGEYHIGAAALERNLLSRYRYRGFTDSTLYKEPEVRRMFRNYSIAFVRLSEQYLRDGRPGDAERVMGESFRIFDPDPDIRMLGYSVFRQHGDRDALARFAGAEMRRIPRGDRKAAMETGVMFLRFSIPEGAIPLFRDMTGTWKNDPEVWDGYATALFMAEDYRGALAAAYRLREIKPADPRVSEMCRIIEEKLGEHDSVGASASGEVR